MGPGPRASRSAGTTEENKKHRRGCRSPVSQFVTGFTPAVGWRRRRTLELRMPPARSRPRTRTRRTPPAHSASRLGPRQVPPWLRYAPKVACGGGAPKRMAGARKNNHPEPHARPAWRPQPSDRAIQKSESAGAKLSRRQRKPTNAVSADGIRPPMPRRTMSWHGKFACWREDRSRPLPVNVSLSLTAGAPPSLKSR